MELAAGLDFGGSSVKAWTASLAHGRPLAVVRSPLETLRPEPFAAEFEPNSWWEAAARSLDAVLAEIAADGHTVAGLTVSSLRQGFVLTGGKRELGHGVLNSDRRGAPYLGFLKERFGSEGLYQVTGHWPAPELTLPKLLSLRGHEPDRWARTERVLFVHDWAIWRLCGAEVTERSLGSGGQLLDVGRREWARDLLDGVGLRDLCLGRLVDAGEVVGTVREPPSVSHASRVAQGVPVVAGGGDTQCAALGAGGMEPGVATVVAGSTTPVQVVSDVVPEDPLRHPWVSTHLAPDRWAVETNAGYTGANLDWLARATGSSATELGTAAWDSSPGARGLTAVVATPVWSEERWARKAPAGFVGLRGTHGAADLARALIEAHAFAIRANVDDLERAVRRQFSTVILTGGAADDQRFRQLVADVTCRVISVPHVAYPPAVAGARLVARALGRSPPINSAAMMEYRPRQPELYEQPYQRYLEGHEVFWRELREDEA